MLVLVVIGGIGSGKSSVVQFLKEQGLPTLDLDEVGHVALRDPRVKSLLADSFGNEILDEKGNVNRAVLAMKAFATPEDTAELDSITRPWIFTSMEKWLAEKNAEGIEKAVVEISAYKPEEKQALLKMGFSVLVLAVIAPNEVRIQRASAKGFDAADTANRIARQPTDEERATYADHIIENTGSLADLEQAVAAIVEEL